jgi:hypothetical protein
MAVFGTATNAAGGRNPRATASFGKKKSRGIEAGTLPSETSCWKQVGEYL